MAARSNSLVVENQREISELKEKVFLLDGCLYAGGMTSFLCICRFADMKRRYYFSVAVCVNMMRKYCFFMTTCGLDVFLVFVV